MSADAPTVVPMFPNEPDVKPQPEAPSEPTRRAAEARPIVSNGALYRRYRSRDFGELVGQEPIVQTLRNALANGRLAHAYLFCGPRGTGKTTTARLLAKAVNCLAPEGTERPCNACEACRAVNEGRAIDLIEIDAASNNSVEDVRELRERVNFAPAVFRRKFYIIDEAHMMSISAFNALLKTLEEPPAHTIFVLATTDPQKLPMTILSRCQRYDFRRIPLPLMVGHMTGIVAQEGYTAEPGVLELIGRQATGCMRDALSLLDQLMSFSDGTLTLEQVQAVLGARGTAEVAGFVDRLIAGDMAGGLGAINSAIESGADPRQFNRQVVEHLRGLLLLRAGGDGAALDATEDEITRLRAQAERASLPALAAWIRAFSGADTGLKNGVYGALPLELALVEAQMAGSAPPSRPEAPPAARTPSKPETPPTARLPRPEAASPASPSRPETAPTLRAQAAEPPEDGAAPTPPPAGGVDIGYVRENWGRVMERARARFHTLPVLLGPGVVIGIEDKFLVLGFAPKSDFHRKKLEEPKNRDMMESVMAEVLGHPYRLRCVAMPDAEPGEPPANLRAQKAKAILDED